MKLDEYIKLLNETKERVGGDVEVIISKDSEGNYFSPFSDILENCIYIAESAYDGEIYSKDGYGEEEWSDLCEEEHKKCIVLYPIN